MEADSTQGLSAIGEEPPPDFIAHVARALRLLYDPSALLRSPLARLLIPPDALPQQHGPSLRALLLEAVESLNPGPSIPFRSLSARSYQALNLHYVQGHTIEQVAHYLALSMRQTYRDLRKGEADLATVLWQRRQSETDALAQGGDAVLRQEVERLTHRPANVSLQEALDHAAASLASLSGEAGVELHLALPRDYRVRADATGLRQCLTAMLSYTVQAGIERVRLAEEVVGETLLLHVLSDGAGSVQPASGLLATARTLAKAIGAELRTWPDRKHVGLCLRLPLATSATILVIDDNEGLAELFQRYLSKSNCTVLSATNPDEGLKLAKEYTPGAIFLDIIMPGADGWAFLAHLKFSPATAAVPVVVCSVFNDPELARSLGAAAFIPKPVSQASLLGAIGALGLL